MQNLRVRLLGALSNSELHQRRGRRLNLRLRKFGSQSYELSAFAELNCVGRSY